MTHVLNGEPMATTEHQLSIKWTRDYKKFKFLEGNRHTDPIHVKRLIQSMSKKALIAPLCVNEHYEIIDGQNRFEALKFLGERVFYFQVPGYGLDEVQILNTNNVTWKNSDYLNYWITMNAEHYLAVEKFLKSFPFFKIDSALKILAQKADGEYIKKEKAPRVRLFREGLFEVPSLEQSFQIAYKLMDFKEFYAGYNKAKFIQAILGLLKFPNYDHKEMLLKLKQQPKTLVDCANTTQYILLLEDIYNYRRREKISLRYKTK